MKRLLAAVTALVTMATPTAQASVGDHIKLLEAMEANGTTIQINDPVVCERGALGSYIAVEGSGSIFTLCQENRGSTATAVGLTAEDADTIRHEAWHMVQDCVYGGTGDAYLRAIYNSPREVYDWAKKMEVSDEFIAWVVEMYEGRPKHVQVAEVEAYVAAATLDAPTITWLINKYCAK